MGGDPWKKHGNDWYKYDSSYWRKNGDWKKHGKHSKEYDDYWNNKGGNWKKDNKGNWNKYKAVADDAESIDYSDDSSDNYYDEIQIPKMENDDDESVSDDELHILPANSGHNDKGKHDKYDSRDNDYWKKNGDWKKGGKYSKEYNDYWNKNGGDPWKKHGDDYYNYDTSYWRKDGQWKKHGKHSKEYDDYWNNKGGNWKKDNKGNWNKYKAVADDAESIDYSDDSSDNYYDEIQIPK